MPHHPTRWPAAGALLLALSARALAGSEVTLTDEQGRRQGTASLPLFVQMQSAGSTTANQGAPNAGGSQAWFVQVTNFPTTQAVSGTVTSSQGAQNSGGTAAWWVQWSGQSVAVSNLPATQPVNNAGTFAVQNTAATPAGSNTIGNTVPAPSSAAAVGIAPATVQGASSNPVKASAGNFYGFSFTEGATAGYFALLDLAAVPAAGAAIAPKECVPVPVNGYVGRRQDIPDRYLNGIVIVSTSSCTTFTAVVPQIITGVAQ